MISIGRNHPGRTERWFVVGALMFMSGAFVPHLSAAATRGVADWGQGSLAFQAIASGIYVIALLLILPRLELILGLCRQNKALMMLVGLTLLSTFWSTEPELSLRRSIGLLGATTFALYLVIRFPPEEFIRLLALALGLVTVFSLVYAVALPEFGVHKELVYHGAWKGVFSHKNGMGRTMILAMLLFLVLTSDHGRYRWLAWAGVFLCGLLVANSGSRTAWVVGGALLMLLILLHFQQKTHYSVGIPVIVLTILALASGAAWVATNLDTATALIGREATLTGRTEIWSLAVEFGMDRPLLGYGYRAFWHGSHGAEVERLLFRVGVGHSGLMDLWLELGLVGLITYLVTLGVCLRRLTPFLGHPAGTLGLWYLALVGYIIIYGFMSSRVVLEQNGLVSVLFGVTLFYLSDSSAVSTAAGKRLR